MNNTWYDAESSWHIAYVSYPIDLYDMCTDGRGHCVKWVDSGSTIGMSEICIKCGITLAQIVPDGRGCFKRIG